MRYDYFQSNEDIDTYIREKNISALRFIIMGYVNRDPTFATTRYVEAIDYLSDKVDIWDKKTIRVSGEYTLPEDNWNEKYFTDYLLWLKENFTKERVEEIKKIGKYVFNEKITSGKEEAENFQ